MKSKEVTIFIASSIIEFQQERIQLMAFEPFLNEVYKDSNVRFRIIVSDVFSNSFNEKGSQERYNIEIRNSRLVFFLIGKSIGEYTRQEFVVAKEQYLSVRKPLIYTFFRYDIDNPEVDHSVKQFVINDLRVEDENHAEKTHFYTLFDHIDTIKFHIMSEIVRNPDIGGTIELKSGIIQLNGEDSIPLKNIPLYEKNEDLKELKLRYYTLNEKYTEVSAKLAQVQDFSLIKTAYEIGIQRNELLNEIEEREKIILENSIMFMDRARFGESINWREQKAINLYNNGDYAAGDDILSDELWETEIDRLVSVGELVTKEIHGYISGKRTLIASWMAKGVDEQAFIRINDLYEKISGLSEKHMIDYDVFVDFSRFLFNQNRFEKALYLAEKCDKQSLARPEIITDEQKYKLYVLLGRLHHRYKESAKAIDFYEKAELLIVESEQDGKTKIAELNVNKANVYLEGKDYKQAEEAFKKVVGTLNPKGVREERILLGKSYNGLGRIYKSKNHVKDSIENYEQAIKVYSSINDEEIREKLSSVYNNIAILYADLTDDYKRAEEWYLESLRLREEGLKSNPAKWTSKYALALTNLSRLYTKALDPEKAVFYAEKAYAIREKLYEMDQRAYGQGFAITCYSLSMAKLKNHIIDEAISYGKKAIEILEKKYREKSNSFATEMSVAYRVYAESLRESSPESAEYYYQRMSDIEVENAWMKTNWAHGLIMNHWSYASFLERMPDRKADAKEHYEIAIGYASVLAKDNPFFECMKKNLEEEMFRKE